MRSATKVDPCGTTDAQIARSFDRKVLHHTEPTKYGHHAVPLGDSIYAVEARVCPRRAQPRKRRKTCCSKWVMNGGIAPGRMLDANRPFTA